MGILSGLMGNASVVSNEQLQKDYEKIRTPFIIAITRN